MTASEPSFTELDLSGADAAATTSSPASPIRGWTSRFDSLRRPASPALTYAGVATIALGFLLIGIGWYQVSGLANVALQMPYLVSAALTGLGLIVIGVTAIVIAAKRQESAQRLARLDNLEALLSQLNVRAPEPPPVKRARPRSTRS